MTTVATAAPSTPTGPACGSTQRAASTQRISNATQLHSHSHIFFWPEPRQRNATQPSSNATRHQGPRQLNSTQLNSPAQHNSKRERSERAPVSEANPTATATATSTFSISLLCLLVCQAL